MALVMSVCGEGEKKKKPHSIKCQSINKMSCGRGCPLLMEELPPFSFSGTTVGGRGSGKVSRSGRNTLDQIDENLICPP